ncbi:MAG: transporter substrate-binding domain-containing protein [Thiohalocapsa sp.]|jgi:ABC-type amino acid transport substrate-binding protein
MRSPITWLVALFVLGGADPLVAQPETSEAGTAAGATEPAHTEPMTIATRHPPPFAIKSDDGQWSGIPIALWGRISERNGYDFRYTQLGLKEMLDAVVAGRIDAGAAALTITSDREQVMDFSHPFHTAGLAVAVPLRSTSLFQVVKRFLSPAFLAVVAALLTLVVAVGVLIWLAERRGARRDPLRGVD